ncbi:unnamed protein product [Phytomonas sp. EM1]|nr:unnamed protein product [Phytomonas sp. EM1]|eukprot:CCW64983.1 unnamed protein product [Phytomonas sp. isolate EM1]
MIASTPAPPHPSTRKGEGKGKATKAKPTTRKAPRVRMTNKALESQQFSTLRTPRRSEVAPQTVNVAEMFDDARRASAPTFDPIPADTMFDIVTESAFWPPPSLKSLEEKTGIAVAGGDGFDTFNRQEDDARARRENREREKVVLGELHHPRGKPRRNAIIKLDDSSASENEEEAS